jgi:hypothetical protein
VVLPVYYKKGVSLVEHAKLPSFYPSNMSDHKHGSGSLNADDEKALDLGTTVMTTLAYPLSLINPFI